MTTTPKYEGLDVFIAYHPRTPMLAASPVSDTSKYSSTGACWFGLGSCALRPGSAAV